jgi:hypothetical protein
MTHKYSPFSFAICTCQAHAQDTEVGVVKAVSKQSVPVEKYEFKTMVLPMVNMSQEEIDAYERNPANKPKIDSQPTGKKAQPSKQESSILSTF